MWWLNMLIALAVALVVYRVTTGLLVGLMAVWEGSRGPDKPADSTG